MSDIDVKSITGLAGSGVNYAYAVKAGPWIFLTGHEAFNFATGSTKEVAGPPGFSLFGAPRYRREGNFLLARMREILRDFGSDLSHGVRLDQFYPTTAPVDPYHLARRAEFGDYIPPSTSVVMERCFCADANISASLMAVVPSEDYKIERVYPPNVESPTWSGFVPTITCNEFVFVAGQMATGPDALLDPRAHVTDKARWGGSEIRKQTEYLITHKLTPALEASGSSLQHAVKAQVYIEQVSDFPDFVEVWDQHFANIPCAVTVVPTKNFGSVGGIIEINMLALKKGAKRQKSIVEADVPQMAAYGPAVRVGEFLFPSGLMAIEEDGAIADATTSAAFDGLSHAGYVQASTIFRYAEALCAKAGTSMQNVVRAQYFVSDVGEFAGISAAWVKARGEQPHPFVCVGVPDRMPAPGAKIIADFWIYAP
jgi:enamine deaminase RidA (YjgF/YER057c/UK114 family)